MIDFLQVFTLGLCVGFGLASTWFWFREVERDEEG